MTYVALLYVSRWRKKLKSLPMYANIYANIYMQSLPDGVQTCEQQQTGAQPNPMRVMKI